jgi:hypothetical protein
VAKNPAAVALGTLGGSVTSKRKPTASRENGKKGGRPPETLRWEVEWFELTAAAKKRREANENYEYEPDRDVTATFETFDTKAAAHRYARKLVDSYGTAYGAATVTKQRLEPVEGTQSFDWENVGEPEYVD